MEPVKTSTPPAIAPVLSVGSMGRDLWQDLRYAARVFSKQPAFAAAAVLTLALGIGATTAIFSVVYGVLLKPLPFHEPERLVSLTQIAPHGAGANHGPGTYLTYRENQQVFEGIGAWDPTEVSITGGGDPERVQGLLVSASTLPLLRVQPDSRSHLQRRRRHARRAAASDADPWLLAAPVRRRGRRRRPATGHRRQAD